MIVDMKSHWETVYDTVATDAVSWYQREPGISLELIRRCGLHPDDPIIDVGGGTSPLTLKLLRSGFTDISVLDISSRAIGLAQKELGEQATSIRWITENVTGFRSTRRFKLWHDRAVFHFLTDEESCLGYLRALENAIAPGGFVIIATFSESGPSSCSGLPVQRYSRELLVARFDPILESLESLEELHTTPGGRQQAFLYCRFRARR